MPAQFTIQEADLRKVLKELRELDPNLRKELQKEMRSGLKPIVQKLQGTVPKQSPLSGFATASAQGTRYSWGAVTGVTKTPLGKTNAGFEIMELAGSRSSGNTPQGRAMIAALARVAPIKKGLGRFVLPAAKGEVDEATRIAKGIIEKFVTMVNRRIR